jgi:hypothetical protein
MDREKIMSALDYEVKRLKCQHEFVRTSEKPEYTYFDYSGYEVGVFCLRCSKCGKRKYRKFLADKQIGELLRQRSVT